MTTPFPCWLDGVATEFVLTDEGLTLGNREIAWHQVDTVAEGNHTLVLGIGTGVEQGVEPISVSRLGTRFDECAETVREVRGRARRAALAQGALAPIAVFTARGGEAVTDVTVLPHALLVEPRGEVGTFLPWGLVREVERDGYRLTVQCRGLPPVEVRGLGQRTDEFVAEVAKAREALNAGLRAALVEFGVPGVTLPDGWACAESEVGAGWAVLRAAWLAGARADEAALLAGGADELRLGLWTEGGSTSLPFLVARRGERVAVEAVDTDDRATFVFATDEVDTVAAGLLLTSFRRELLMLPDTELGHWSAAVRTQPAVRWLRERLAARVVHDDRWADSVRRAMEGAA